MTTSAYDMLRSVATESSGSPTTLPLAMLHRDPTQPRQTFDEAALAELAASIRQSGIIEPLVVTPHPDRDGEWIILVGERRHRAAAKAGLATVPVIIRREISDVERLVLQLTENDQRTDLTLRERAAGYLRLMEMMPSAKKQELAERLGIGGTTFANTILAAKVTEGPAFEALQEDIIQDPLALRLFVSLAKDDQAKLLTTARTTGVTLSRPMLQRFKDNKKKTANAAQQRSPDRTATPPEPGEPSEDEAEPTTEPAPHVSQGAAAVSRRAAEPAQHPSTPAPKITNDYLAALTWQHWQILFGQLGIPLPENPDDAGYTLLEFLEARAAQD